MLNSADFITPNGFNAYNFAHQPGTSTAMAASAIAAAYSLDTGTLMQNTMRANGGFRNDITRPSNKRERTKFDETQLAHMERFFAIKPYPDGNDREQMAKQLGLTEVKVQIWFKNRRAKDRNQKHLQQLIHRNKDSTGIIENNNNSNSNNNNNNGIKRHANNEQNNNSTDSIINGSDTIKKIKLETLPLDSGIKDTIDNITNDYTQFSTTTSTITNINDWDNNSNNDKDIKNFTTTNSTLNSSTLPITNNYQFNFDNNNTTATFNNHDNNLLTNNTTNNLNTWMTNNTYGYPFTYLPPTYYGHNTMNPNMNQMTGYPDLYASSYGQMSTLKDNKF